MDKTQIEFLKTLVETPSPTGSEERVANIVRYKLDEVANEVRTDTMGSVHAVLNAFIRPSEETEPESAEKPDPTVTPLSRGELAAIRPEEGRDEEPSSADDDPEEIEQEIEEDIEEYDPDYIEDEPFEVKVGASSLGIPMPSASSAPEESWRIDVLNPAKMGRDEHEVEAPVLMLSAHMDEIGLMVTYISDDGFLSVASIGGVDAAILPGLRVDVHTASGVLRGVVGRKPIHLIATDERKTVTELDKLVIDLGLPAKTVKEKVQVGDSITFGVGFECFGEGMAVSRALDDKCGVFVACRVMEELASAERLDATFVAAVTVQEEIGTRGAITSAHSIDPDVAIAFDVTHATDYPGIDRTKYGYITLGGGPVIAKGPNINPLVFDRLVAAARKEGIPYQIEAEPSVTGTDARSIQVSREGVPTGLVSVPLRYMHTPTETICLDDLVNAVKLITRFTQDLEPDATFIPGVSPAIEMPEDTRAKTHAGEGSEACIEELEEEIKKLKAALSGETSEEPSPSFAKIEPLGDLAPKSPSAKPTKVTSAKLPQFSSLNTLTRLSDMPIASSSADDKRAPLFDALKAFGARADVEEDAQAGSAATSLENAQSISEGEVETTEADILSFNSEGEHVDAKSSEESFGGFIPFDLSRDDEDAEEGK